MVDDCIHYFFEMKTFKIEDLPTLVAPTSKTSKGRKSAAVTFCPISEIR
ncbi:hypothetical protein NEICINOT_03739 [Neisseria cinerea ATCC 14685]|uniref:Uncharacterized protein n=1 Tax=Neisseria cinerea ATCC 14685 TaxID=546262 RepID=D0W261_NEICI|nr:hypothetical protein NEICINOT_03739 [Neisseria cinerea ATCC 14685]